MTGLLVAVDMLRAICGWSEREVIGVRCCWGGGITHEILYARCSVLLCELLEKTPGGGVQYAAAGMK